MERDSTLDAMKGVGIMAVIIGHLSDYFTAFIFSFHMPLFFITGGYLYKQKETWLSVKSDAKRLLIPYFATAVILLIYQILATIVWGTGGIDKRLISIFWANGSNNHTSAYFSDAPAIGAIWFLWALFWCRLIYNQIARKTNNIYILGTICLSLTVLGIWLDTKIINLPLAILPGLGALLFFWVGHYIRSLGGFKKIPIYIVIIGLFLWIVSFTSGSMSMVRCYYSHPIINILGSVGASIVIYLLISKLRWGGVICRIGMLSLVILCLHLIDLELPIREILGIPYGYPAIIFDMAFCILGVIFIGQFKYLRTIFGVGTNILPTLYKRIEKV